MPSQDRFITLDGMRGLAALVVAGSHISELVGLGDPPHAHLAGDFFFVLSGFVIAHAYERRMATTMRPIDFIRVRVIRLHPLIALGSGISLAAALAGSFSGDGPGAAMMLWTAVAAMLMIPVHSGSWPADFPLDGPAWFLFAEYAANIAFALLAVTLTAARLRLILLAGIAMLLVLAVGPAGLESYWRVDLVGLSLLRVVYPYFAGVLINWLHRTGASAPGISPLLAMTILSAILLAPLTAFDTAFEFAMIVAVFPPLVLASARDRLTERQAKWMLIAGRLSYPLYMLHFPLAVLLVPLALSALPPAAALASVMLVVAGASHLALRYYDEPLRAWLSTCWRSAQRQTIVA
ncbi:acyltransferase [Sphingomonas limnosediminicola]